MSVVKIFAAKNSKYLGERIAKAFGSPLGKIELQEFSDGEMCPVFNESVRGFEIFLVQSTIPPSDNFLELLLMIDAAKRSSAKSITVVLPYFGYARQDRKDKPRVPIAAKLMANLISSAGADRIVTCDLHADQIQGFFDIPVDHLDGTAIFVPYLRSLNLKNIIFASPDVGGVKRTRTFAKFFKAELVVCDKYRSRANEVTEMRLIGDVKDKDVVLVDDMIDTGGTLCRAAELLMEKGAKSVRAVITHGVLSGNAYENIENSVLTELAVTDTLPVREDAKKIKVLTVADLMAKAIRIIHDNASISSLFINP